MLTYRDQLEILFKVRGCELIELARQLNKEHPRNFEFQMLMGAHDKRKEELAGEGIRSVVIYPTARAGWVISCAGSMSRSGILGRHWFVLLRGIEVVGLQMIDFAF